MGRSNGNHFSLVRARFVHGVHRCELHSAWHSKRWTANVERTAKMHSVQFLRVWLMFINQPFFQSIKPHFEFPLFSEITSTVILAGYGLLFSFKSCSV